MTFTAVQNRWKLQRLQERKEGITQFCYLEEPIPMHVPKSTHASLSWLWNYAESHDNCSCNNNPSSRTLAS